MEEILLSSIWSFLLGLISAFFIKVYRKLHVRHLSKKSRQQVIIYDSEKDGLIPLHSWSYYHRLLPQNMKIQLKHRPKQSYLNEGIIDTSRKDFEKQNYRGRNVCYCVGYNVDHQDNKYGQIFVLKVAPCDYSESLALEQYLRDNPDKKKEIAAIVNNDPQQYFSFAIPSVIFINLIVISENDNLLVLRRSKSVASARGLWSVGAYETMEYAKSSTAKVDNNFHSLAERCLDEELGIYRTFQSQSGEVTSYYNDIFISSMSLSLFHMGLLVFGVVKLKNLTESEIELRISSSHGKYESDQIRWLPLNKKDIKDFIENDNGIYQDFIDKENGEWLSYVKSSLNEAVRVKDYNLFVV